ncbi:MAG: aminoglycoside phosphotransferase family protein [Anaerolineales bacterium]|nr:aminoglycoside phosphotransferase family protein [Anaerolineales bacterium]
MDKQAGYLQTILEAYPNLIINTAHLHKSDGQFNDILFINDELIFRFPRYAEVMDGFLQEVELLQKLQGCLSLPIPNPIYVSENSRTIGNVFMGYRIIEGEPLLREVLNAIQDAQMLQIFAQQLAGFLNELHSISCESLSMKLTAPDTLTETEIFYENIQKHLFVFMRSDARTQVSQHFEEFINEPRLHQYKPSIHHGDFGSSNILFDSHTGRISGIIDFGFAGLGDPALDIAAISTFGDSFFARICERYPVTESTLERAKFYRGTYALYEALHGFRNNDKEAFTSGMEQYI